MKNTRIIKNIRINASKEKVWKVLADFGNIANASPNISKSWLTSDKKNGVGATRHCDFAAMGVSVEERIIDWDEGKSMKIDIFERKNMPLIAEMKADFKVDGDDNTTSLTAGFEYGMSNIIGDIMNLVVMKDMNEKAWTKFLAGIKHHAETGEVVTKDTGLDLLAVHEV